MLAGQFPCHVRTWNRHYEDSKFSVKLLIGRVEKLVQNYCKICICWLNIRPFLAMFENIANFTKKVLNNVVIQNEWNRNAMKHIMPNF